MSKILANWRHSMGEKNSRSNTPCLRTKPIMLTCQMGNLPSECESYERPATRIDFCGPVLIKKKKLPNTNAIKPKWLSMWVSPQRQYTLTLSRKRPDHRSCFGITKTILCATRRAKSIYSDNEKIFIGANRELWEMYIFTTNTYSSIRDYLTREQVNTRASFRDRKSVV